MLARLPLTGGTSILLALLLAAPCAAEGPHFTRLSLIRDTVSQYDRATLTFSLDRFYDNPYDPDQVDCAAEVLGPDGRRLVVPAFWHEPMRPEDDFTAAHVFTNPGREHYASAGPGRWELRFAPTTPGRWRGRLRARDPGGETLSDEFALTCTAGTAHGYLRTAPNGQFLRFDDGTGFVPRGLCLAWARGGNETDTYDSYLSRLAALGANTVRVWMCHWAWLEWTAGESGALRAYEGPGRYNQQVAHNFDRLIELAERKGIFLQLCLNNGAWEFGRPDGKNDHYDSWGGNPYNARNGGPCAEPGDFWTKAEARRLYRNRLRYTVARWGYSPSVLAWELWNEQGSETDATAAWHREMADYLRAVDPCRHLVTTSTWLSDARELPRTFQAMDLVQLHYASERFVELAREAFPDKPCIVGEGPWTREALARAGYVSPLVGAAGPPLTWHSGPDSPVEREDLYPLLGGLFGFWRDFPAADPVTPLGAAEVRVAVPDGAAYAPVVLHPGFNTWLRRATQAEFTVRPDGSTDASGMSDRLYGSNPDRAPYRNPPTFVVDYPAPGAFAVRLGECSGPATLVITLDGGEALRYAVPGEGRRSPPEDTRWQTVQVPAGPHRIGADNAGADWMSVGPFVLSDYRDVTRYPPVKLLGLVSGDQARLWLANDWAEVDPRLGLGPPPELTARVALSGLRQGQWAVAWTDPLTGGALRQERARSDGRRLALEVAGLRGQLAARLERVGD